MNPPDPPSPALPLALQERYRVVRQLGAGGMGTVLLAEDTELGREVAIKRILRPDQPTALERFRREARTLARLEHPHLLRVHDFGEDPDGAYLVTEHVPGAELDARERPRAELRDRLLEVAGALEFLHREGLVHRDVKPSNILVTPEGRAVLIDLGLVAEVDATRLTATGMVVGTPAYLAPEVLRGEEPRPPADWYAWGATWFVLVERRAPFSQEALLEMARTGEVPPLDLGALAADPGVARLLRRCLHPDPGWRPAGADDVRQILAGGGEDPPAATSPAARPRRGPWLAGAAGLGALLLVAAILGPGGRSAPPGLAPELVAAPAGLLPEAARTPLGPWIEAVGRELRALPEVDADPAAWGRIADALPSLAELRRRGLAEPLHDPEHPDRAALEALGERFRRDGLPAPLGRMLAPLPDRAVELRALRSRLPKPELGLPVRAPPGTWLGAMELSAREVIEARRRLDATIRDPRALAAFLGIEEDRAGSWMLATHPLELGDMAGRFAETRLRWAAGVGAGVEALERFVYAAARACEEPGPGAQVAATAATWLLAQERVFLYGGHFLEGRAPVELAAPRTAPAAKLRRKLLEFLRRAMTSLDLPFRDEVPEDPPGEGAR